MEIISILGIVFSILVAIAAFALLYHFLGSQEQTKKPESEQPEKTTAYVKIQQENRKLRRTVQRLIGMMTKTNNTKKRELTGIVDQLIPQDDATDNPWSSNWKFKTFDQPWGDAVSPTSAWGENTTALDYPGAQSDMSRPGNKNVEDDMRKMGLTHDD